MGILILAAWPNAAFDLCGICCGHFLMPCWDFFGATFIGKAFLKVGTCTTPPCAFLTVELEYLTQMFHSSTKRFFMWVWV